MDDNARPNNGQTRAAARLAARRVELDSFYANTPEPTWSRQVQRRMARGVTTHAHKPGVYAPRNRDNRHVLRTRTENGREFAFHATKGLRVRRAS
jgi:hypothetical protein